MHEGPEPSPHSLVALPVASVSPQCPSCPRRPGMGEKRAQLPGSLMSHREQAREMPVAPSTHGGGPWLTRRCSELAFL